jgi:hypothetical protein
MLSVAFVQARWLLARGSDGVVAIATIDRPTFPGFKRNLGSFAALGAGSGERLSFGAESRLNVAVVPTAQLTGFARLAAGWTAFGGVIMTLSLKGFLFFHTEHKFSTAVKASDRFFF